MPDLHSRAAPTAAMIAGEGGRMVADFSFAAHDFSDCSNRTSWPR
jgi:hypothetical protein